MLDWIGSLRLEHRDSERVVLSLSGGTRILGAVIAALTGALAWQVWGQSPWAAVVPLVGLGFGLLLLTLGRRFVFDRHAGTLVLEQRFFGFGTRSVVPLFHLRAVIVTARPDGVQTVSGSPSKYVAYLERRVGGPIYLDEARKCAPLMAMAEAISEVADVRLEYEAIPA